MATFYRLKKYKLITLLGVGAASGAAYYISSRYLPNRDVAYSSWTTSYETSVKWDYNWDHRQPQSIVKPAPSKTLPEDENSYNSKIEKNTTKVTRNIFLIRHGQYNLDGPTDKERILTDLGRKQADFTGQRLKILNINFDTLVQSTMTRAQETANIIAKHLPEDIVKKDCSMIEEGAPVPPEPPIGHWKPELHKFYQDGARIEAAYRKYFHRADAKEEKDSFTLIVCHANVIRYFVCRALQFPAEGWLRISLNHASITWISILPSGRVILRCLGDTGHIDPEYITSR